jgi:transposase-like protein
MMSQAKLRKIHQEVKEKALAKIRKQWFKEYKKIQNVSEVCRKYGISRSVFYYWKNRIDLVSSSGRHKSSKEIRLISYSRKPKTNPRAYPDEIIKLIIKIRKRTGRGAEYIWFMLKDKYAFDASVTGTYKVLKRNNLIKKRKHKHKANKIYEAPKYLPGEKVQVDVKYVKLEDKTASKLGKKYRWVYQYTALDVATGIKCKLIYEVHSQTSSLDFLSKVRYFYPFKISIIQTDNGSEFTFRLQPDIHKEHPFTTQCKLYGYTHNLIPPAYPRANSHVERTHRIDEEEVYRGRTFTSLEQLHKINLKNLKYFNEKRPQKSKHFLPPLKFGILKFRLHKQKLNYTILNV